MTTRRHLLAALGAAPVVLGLGRPARAQTAPVYAEEGIAIDGTDPVAYFTEGRPVGGAAEHEVSWQGATWRFASAANRDAFEAAPEAYAPQYGGWCAWAVAEGYTASTVPEAWRIVDKTLPQLLPERAAALGARHPRQHRPGRRQLAGRARIGRAER
jgi:YHS domain-containing protein